MSSMNTSKFPNRFPYRLICAGLLTAASALFFSADRAESAVVYQDSFNRTGVLDGTSPDVVNTGGNVWVTNTNSGNYSTNGSAAYLDNTDFYGAAYLPVNGGSGVILDGTVDFTLSAVLTPVAFKPEISISLTNAFNADGDLNNVNLVTLNVGNGYAFARVGNTLPAANFSTPLAGVPQTVSLAYSALNQTITFTAGGVSVYTLTGVTTTQISSLQYVAFGNAAFDTNPTATFQNFTLDVVPEPAALGLIVAAGGVLTVCRRKRSTVLA